MPYRFDPYLLDPDRRELRRGSDLVPVEPQVFDLLLHLLRNRDRVVSKDDLLDAVWHGRIVSESTLFNRINAARAAVGDDGGDQRLIRTLPRKGIRFVGPVQEVPGALDAAPAPSMTAPAAMADRPSIAVLPFTDLGGNAGGDYLGDGMAADIITQLSRFSELVVISRNSSFTYKGKAIDVRQVGAQLGVRYVLEGTIARAGERVRIGAQLIDADTGAHRWAERFERPLEDVFAVQDEVARTIVATIAIQLGKADVQRAMTKPPATWQAYDHFLQGASAFAAFMSSYVPAELYAARRGLQRSLVLDPMLARAHGMLSRTHLSAWVNPVDGDHLDPAVLDRAFAMARHAVQLDPNLPHARAGLGYVLIYLRCHDEALAEFDTAFALNPGFTEWSYILALVYAGEPARAVEAGRSHARLDPFTPAVAHGFIGFAHYMLKEYAAALAPLRDCVRRAPNFRGGHFWLAATLARLGRREEAQAAAREVLRIDPAYTIGRCGRTLAAFRHAGDAEHWFDGLRAAGLPE